MEQTINCLRGKCGEVKWRPDFENQIAYATGSSIIVVDKSRPYLYQYQFTFDGSAVETFEWIKNDKILVVIKNEIIIKNIKEAVRPIFEMNVAM